MKRNPLWIFSPTNQPWYYSVMPEEWDEDSDFVWALVERLATGGSVACVAKEDAISRHRWVYPQDTTPEGLT